MRDALGHSNDQPPSRRPTVLAPAAVLCLFAAVLPAPMPRPSAGVSKEGCLALAERARPATTPIALLEECSALYPGDVELLADLGAVYEVTDAARAEATYRRALNLDPGFADVHFRLGSLLLRRGAGGEALAHADDGLRIQPNRQAFLDLRAAARAAAGSRR